MDSYSGIVLDVRFEVSAEMTYEGSVMNYTARDCLFFQVRNSQTSVNNIPASAKAEEEKKEFEIEEEKKRDSVIAAPRLNIDFSGFRASDKPCKLEVYLHNTNLNIDKDQITGYLRMKELAQEI